jgi:hypothetical protein
MRGLGSLLLVHTGLANTAGNPSNVYGDPGSFPIVCPGTFSNEVTVTARDPVPPAGSPLTLVVSGPHISTVPPGPFVLNSTHSKTTLRVVAKLGVYDTDLKVDWTNAPGTPEFVWQSVGLNKLPVSAPWNYHLDWPRTIPLNGTAAAHGRGQDGGAATLLACGGGGNWTFDPVFDLNADALPGPKPSAPGLELLNPHPHFSRATANQTGYQTLGIRATRIGLFNVTMTKGVADAYPWQDESTKTQGSRRTTRVTGQVVPPTFPSNDDGGGAALARAARSLETAAADHAVGAGDRAQHGDDDTDAGAGDDGTNCVNVTISPPVPADGSSCGTVPCPTGVGLRVTEAPWLDPSGERNATVHFVAGQSSQRVCFSDVGVGPSQLSYTLFDWAPCANGRSFDEDLSGRRCAHLQGRGVLTRQACKAACCAEPACDIWQWIADGSNSCWTGRGTMADCATEEAGWEGELAPPPPTTVRLASATVPPAAAAASSTAAAASSTGLAAPAAAVGAAAASVAVVPGPPSEWYLLGGPCASSVVAPCIAHRVMRARIYPPDLKKVPVPMGQDVPLTFSIAALPPPTKKLIVQISVLQDKSNEAGAAVVGQQQVVFPSQSSDDVTIGSFVIRAKQQGSFVVHLDPLVQEGGVGKYYDAATVSGTAVFVAPTPSPTPAAQAKAFLQTQTGLVLVSSVTGICVALLLVFVRRFLRRRARNGAGGSRKKGFLELCMTSAGGGAGSSSRWRTAGSSAAREALLASHVAPANKASAEEFSKRTGRERSAAAARAARRLGSAVGADAGALRGDEWLIDLQVLLLLLLLATD